jgi:predicted RecB family endonuclease
LFNRIIGNSMFFEVYVFRKLSDAGIPCMFHLQMEYENQGIREIDLLYWDDKGPGVVEVKAGKIKVEELRVFKEKLRQCGIDKFVVICPESEVHRINREIAKTLTFNDLNNLTNLASLVDFKDF